MVFRKLVNLTVFQSSFLLFVTFDTILGKYFCWTSSYNFIVNKNFFRKR